MASSCDFRGAIDHNQPMEVQNEDEGIVRFSLDLGVRDGRCILETLDGCIVATFVQPSAFAATQTDSHNSTMYWILMTTDLLEELHDDMYWVTPGATRAELLRTRLKSRVQISQLYRRK